MEICSSYFCCKFVKVKLHYSLPIFTDIEHYLMINCSFYDGYVYTYNSVLFLFVQQEKADTPRMFFKASLILDDTATFSMPFQNTAGLLLIWKKKKLQR